MLQLLQQLLSQTTTETTAPLREKNKAIKTKQNAGNCQTIKIYSTSANKEKQKNLLKATKLTTTTSTTVTTSTMKQEQLIRKSLTTEVSTICCENKTTTQVCRCCCFSCWPKEKYTFQINLIKTKNLTTNTTTIANEEEWQLLYKYTNTSTNNKQLQHLQQKQLPTQFQLKCDKTLYCMYKKNNFKMTTQVANICSTNNYNNNNDISNIVILTFILNIFQQYICYKICYLHHNLYAQFCLTQPNKNHSNSLNTANTCINTTATSATTIAGIKDFFTTMATT